MARFYLVALSGGRYPVSWAEAISYAGGGRVTYTVEGYECSNTLRNGERIEDTEEDRVLYPDGTVGPLTEAEQWKSIWLREVKWTADEAEGEP